MAIINSENWRNFFDKFKELPVLWQVKNENYKNKNYRNNAWKVLLEVFQLIEKDATIEQLKRKVANIRSCYRRELKKKNVSEKSGAGGEDIYIPSLWYFDFLDFLKDQETSVPGISTIIDTDDESFDISDEHVLGKRQRQRKKPSNKNEFLQKAVDYLDEVKKDSGGIVKDDANVFAEGWACSFRKLNEQQKLFTKKIIDEALLMGQLNKLSLDSSISSQSSSSKSSSEESRSSTHYRFASRDTSGTSTPLHNYRFASRDTSRTSTPLHNYRLSSRDTSHQNIMIDNETYFPNTHASAIVYENVDELLSDTQYS